MSTYFSSQSISTTNHTNQKTISAATSHIKEFLKNAQKVSFSDNLANSLLMKMVRITIKQKLKPAGHPAVSLITIGT